MSNDLFFFSNKSKQLFDAQVKLFIVLVFAVITKEGKKKEKIDLILAEKISFDE